MAAGIALLFTLRFYCGRLRVAVYGQSPTASRGVLEQARLYDEDDAGFLIPGVLLFAERAV